MPSCESFVALVQQRNRCQKRCEICSKSELFLYLPQRLYQQTVKYSEVAKTGLDTRSDTITKKTAKLRSAHMY